MTSQRAKAQSHTQNSGKQMKQRMNFSQFPQSVSLTKLTKQRRTSKWISPEHKLPATLISSTLSASLLLPHPDAALPSCPRSAVVPPPHTAAAPLFHSSSARGGRQVSAAQLFILEGKPLHQTAPADWEHWLHFTPTSAQQ